MHKIDFSKVVESVVYILLLVFFTFTFIAVECLKNTHGVYDAYLKDQANVSALITNFGLYFMILIDYMSGKSRFEPWVIWSMALLIMVDIFIFGDACVINEPDKYEAYENLLKFPRLFEWMHVGTLLFLVFMKYKSLEDVKATSAV